jgi:insertion element IS1 protein InsB
MVLSHMHCPTCHSTDGVKHGKPTDGKQCFLCRNPDCAQQTFFTTYVYKGRLPEVKQQIIDLTMNGNGIRDTARVLHSSQTTVLDTFKKESVMQHVNNAWLTQEPADAWHVIV